MNVTNDDGTPLLYVNARVTEGSEMAFTGNVPCRAGMFLSATQDAAAKIEARRSGTADAFADLEAAPISLTPYAGSVIKFDFRVTGLPVTTSARASLPVKVTYNP